MKSLRALALGLDRVVARIEAGVVIVLVSSLTAVTFAQVVTRYGLGDPLIWSEELARYLFVWVSMVGAALAIREGGHFGLDLLIGRVPTLRPILAPVVTTVVIVFVAIVLKTGIDETRLASTQFAMTFPMRMQWAYLALPVGAALMLFHLVVRLFLAPTTHTLDVRERPE
jgi:TRAP-type C4-dicarboxylate transport system permease small subunit